jgi:cytochrome c-type biogenesis protein CcmH
MTSFWIIAGIFIVTALLFILPTLLRSREVQEDSGIENDEANIGVYRDQLTELENDFRNDILSQSQYEKSKQELQQRLLQDVPEKNMMTRLTVKKGRSIATSFIITLAIPLSAVFLYLSIGDTRGLLSQAQLASATQMQSANAAEGPEGHPEFSSVLENLIARLNDNPDDIEGWVMLGRTYTIMGRYDEATETYAKLVELVPDSPQILSDYADVLAMSNQGVLAGEPAELIHQALSIDPEYPKALALAGTVEFEQKRFEQAADYWERLLAVIPVDSKLAESVSESIAEAKSLSSNGQVEPVLEQASIPETDNQENQTAVADSGSDDSSTTTDTVADASISGTVTLSGAIAAKAAPNDTLFIYARAETGPRMPLAIHRLKVSDIPANFTLNDDMAMTPTMKISSFPEVVVEARISKSGQAVPTSGDLQGFSQPVKLGDKDISIVIDQQVP